MTELTTTNGAPGALLHRLASATGVSAKDYYDTVMRTVMPSPQAKKEEVMAFLAVADQYGLNPFLKQLYAFPAKGGGIVPMMGYDGWAALVARQPNHDGTTFAYADDGSWVECSVHDKRKAKPTTVREYLEECKRNTEPWRNMPNRMLRNRAFCQAARLAYGIGGIMLEDEVEQWQEREVKAEVHPLEQQVETPEPEPQKDAPPTSEDMVNVVDLFDSAAKSMDPDQQ